MSQINVNTIKDKSGLGAPSFPNGVNATGVITATSFSGDGGNLTGIDASSLKVGGTTKVQATSTGLVITGIATASNFKTGSTNVHSVGVEAAGINVLGGDTPIGAGSTIYDNGNASFNGNVTSDGNITAAGNVTAAGNINANGNIVGDNSTNITGINAITASGNISAVNATFTGNVSVGATLTYEDVTNIDSVGLVTARGGVRVTSGGMVVAGISTFSGALDINAGVNISGLGDFAASTFNNIRLAYSGDNEIDTSTGNLILDSASGTVVVSDNFITNGSNTLGSALQNNTTYINSTTAAHSNANTLVVGHGSGNYAGMTFQCAAAYPGGIYFTDTDNGQEGGIAYYHNGDQLRFYAGSTQYMSVDSSAITAVNSVPFVGNLTGNVTGNTSGSSGSCTGNALTATTLQNARTIAGVSFNGSANISLNNNAITNGAGYITASGTAALATSVTVTANNGNNENVYLAFVDSSAGGTQGIETDGGLSYNPSTNALTTTEFIGGLTGNASGTSGGFTAGNASNLNSGTVASARLGSSGTRSSSTYLRGDNTWADDGVFLRSDANDSMSGVLNLTSSTEQKLILSGSNNPMIRFKEGTTNKVQIQWDSTAGLIYFWNDEQNTGFQLGSTPKWYNGSGYQTLWHQGNDGSGSGLDADLLDGIDSSSFLRSDANDSASGSYSFTNSYNAFGNGTGSVSNNGSWNARVNVAGSSHARLDVQSVSDGIITTMSAHTGHSKGQLGTRSNHGVSFISNGNERAVLTTGGAFSVIDTISDSKGNVRSVPTRLEATAYTLVASDAGKCISCDNGCTVPNNVFAAGDVVTIINTATSNKTITQGSGLTMRNTGDDGNYGNVDVKQYAMCTVIFTHPTVCLFSTTDKS